MIKKVTNILTITASIIIKTEKPTDFVDIFLKRRPEPVNENRKV